MGFPGGSDGKEFCLLCWRPGFDPWVGKFPWRREWRSTPAFLPREFHGKRSLVGYSPQDLKKLNMTEKLTHVCIYILFQGLSRWLSSVQSLSCVQLFAIPWTTARQASLFITNSQRLLKLNGHWVSDTIQLSHSLLPHSPPTFNLSPGKESFFGLGGQSIEASASASVLPMNIQDWFPLGNSLV